jgi:3-isopropylmalate/(R)-2-methylmalate dehydratase small subunit
VTEISGTVWKLGNHIDTDCIIPARYLALPSLSEMARHLLEPLREQRPRNLQETIIVAGENFGCGSSREHAARVIKVAGIKAVVADSLARIFFRNSINCGLAAVECPSATENVKDGDRLKLNITAGRVFLPDGRELNSLPLPELVMRIVRAGGLVPFLKENTLAERRA